MYKYTIKFSNGKILHDKKIKEIIEYIHNEKLDEHNYKYIYDKINKNKLDYIIDIEKNKIYNDDDLTPSQNKYYYNNKDKILQERKEQYNPDKRRLYIDTFREDINKKRMIKYYYQKNIDFLFYIDTNLFIE